MSASYTGTVASPATFCAPPLALMGLEPMRALFEYVHTGLMDRSRLPQGDGHPVVLFPGLGADAMALEPLRRLCCDLGYAACDWGHGCNTGPRGAVEDWLDQLTDCVARTVARHGRSASLVGWSLGGIYAREIARRRPALARQVITLGTPFAGRGEHTNVGVIYQMLSGRRPEIDESLLARLAATPPVPTTSIYSRSDGVVAWQACREAEDAPQAENVEVQASHIGLVWHSRVWSVVADRLAQPQGQWRRYAGAGAAAGTLRAH
ncbi:esterase/lipase family protein [Azohydromonas aeria]|uniref:esterase/lipase family protein n=1 Tax=Azohydromonas aeria TaxID=2590212 RepID=UPI0012FA8EF2|nr:alpha/beta fold hydrolase [Azohydromonas aeria]